MGYAVRIGCYCCYFQMNLTYLFITTIPMPSITETIYHSPPLYTYPASLPHSTTLLPLPLYPPAPVLY